MYHYILYLVFSFLLGLLLTPALRRIGIKYKIYDNPTGDDLKIHKKPIPYLGGIAIFFAFALGLAISLSLYKLWSLPLFFILSLGLFNLGVGLLDDLKNIKFYYRIILQVLGAILLILAGIKIKFIPIPIFTVLLTILYVVGAANAINMEDGLDGLAGGLVMISAIGFIILAFLIHNQTGLLLALTLLGATLGFLIYNFPPASIFMGNNGSYFLGYMLAILAIVFFKPGDIKSLLGPILIIGLPVFDAGLSILRRTTKKKSPFLGDRGHLYDRLNRRFAVRKTVLVCYLFQIVIVICGIFLNVA